MSNDEAYEQLAKDMRTICQDLSAHAETATP